MEIHLRTTLCLVCLWVCLFVCDFDAKYLGRKLSDLRVLVQ